MEKLHPCDSQSSGSSLYLEFILIPAEFKEEKLQRRKMSLFSNKIRNYRAAAETINA
tara:strand:- start:615 stop:785 length:171 start_codon:yes stop_codon:yes gene_type:complete